MSVCPVCYADSECMEICTCKSRNCREDFPAGILAWLFWFVVVVVAIVFGCFLAYKSLVKAGDPVQVQAKIADEMAKNIKENGRLEELVREKKPPERTWRAWWGTKHK